MTTGEKIAALRREKGLSQEALGEQLGLSRQAVSKWEADQAVPTMDNLMELSRLFGVPVDTLLRPEEALPGKGTEMPEGVKISAEGLKISYAPVLTKKTKWFIIAVAAVLLVSVLGNLYAMMRVQGMQTQIDDLKEYIAQLPTMQAMPDEVGSSTENKSEDIADASLEYCTFDGQQYLISVSAMPKLFDETESAQFVLRSEGGSAFYDVRPTAGTGEYTTVLRTSEPDCAVYLTLTKGEQTRSLLVGECKGMGVLSALDAEVYPEFSWSGDTLHAFTTNVEVNMQPTPWGERPTSPVSGTAELHIDGQTVEEQPLTYENRDTAYRDEQIRFSCRFGSHEATEEQDWEVWVRLTDNFGREHLFVAGK